MKIKPNWNRRTFLKNTSAAGIVMLGGAFPFQSFANKQKDESDIIVTILHTNDVHSRIEAFPMDGGKNQGLGGVSARAALIQEIRKTHQHVLLLDAGDIWQGTPYFNFFNGSVEYEMMNRMQYDAATLGNHDFDIGIEGLLKQLPNANFKVLNCNYEIQNSALRNYINEYFVFEKGKIRIGVFGVGIDLKGLVPEKNYEGIIYTNPIENANRIAKKLKEKEFCDFIICLSHLGAKYDSEKVSDEVLAKQSVYIDLILGGHTHTLFEKPIEYKNTEGATVVVNQVGWAGMVLGKLDFHFTKTKEKKYLKYSNKVVGK